MTTEHLKREEALTQGEKREAIALDRHLEFQGQAHDSDDQIECGDLVKLKHCSALIRKRLLVEYCGRLHETDIAEISKRGSIRVGDRTNSTIRGWLEPNELRFREILPSEETNA